MIVIKYTFFHCFFFLWIEKKGKTVSGTPPNQNPWKSETPRNRTVLLVPNFCLLISIKTSPWKPEPLYSENWTHFRKSSYIKQCKLTPENQTTYFRNNQRQTFLHLYLLSTWQKFDLNLFYSAAAESYL